MRNKNSIAVDASCIGNPGVMEYQGIDLTTNKRIIQGGPYPIGTNNIGEFLAVIDAIKRILSNKSDKTIYTDSQTTLHRLASKKIKTTLPHNKQTQELLMKLQEAIIRLKTHDIANIDIQKRETAIWGEIPADFGRKK